MGRTMCWSIEVSAASAGVAWMACAMLLWRRRRRDAWFAGYLFTYTLTQLVDIVLWTYDGRRPLEACPGRRNSFAVRPGGGRDVAPFLVSKYGIPCVVLIQYAAQLSYPSDRWPRVRRGLLVFYGVAAVGMAYSSACTDVVRAAWPEPHDTLRWGGSSFPAPMVVVVAALTGFNFYACVERDEPRVLIVLIAPFLVVITFLAATEGTLALGSKWCTYCLFYAAIFLAAPLWDGRGARPPRPTPVASEFKRRRVPDDGFPDEESKHAPESDGDSPESPRSTPNGLVAACRWRLALGPEP